MSYLQVVTHLSSRNAQVDESAIIVLIRRSVVSLYGGLILIALIGSTNYQAMGWSESHREVLTSVQLATSSYTKGLLIDSFYAKNPL